MTNFKISAADLISRFWWVYVLFAALLLVTQPPSDQVWRLLAFFGLFTVATVMDGKRQLDEQADDLPVHQASTGK